MKLLRVNIQKHEIILLVSIILYVIFWYYIDLFRLYALHEHIFDLGVSIEEGYLVYHTRFTLNVFLFDFFLYGGRIFLSPLSLVINLQIFLLFQTIFLALPALLFYYFAQYNGLNRNVSLIFSLSYLLYPGLGGINWFEWHYQAFFIFFFLLAVLLYLRSHYVIGTILFTLAGLLKFPYLAFNLLFFIIEFFEQYKYKSTKLVNKRVAFILLNIVLSLSILIYSYLLLRVGSYNLTAYLHNGPVGIGLLSQNLLLKLFTVFIILLSFSFLPLFSPRYLIILLPFFFLVLFVYQWEVFPYIFFNQYDVSLVLFGFMGSIEGYKKLQQVLCKKNKKTHSYSSFIIKIKILAKKMTKKNIVYVFIVIILIFSLFYSPYGPLNDLGGVNSIYTYDNENSSLYHDLLNVVSLIPQNVSANNILVQNNIPEIFPRIDQYGLLPQNTLSGPLELDYNFNFFYNYTEILSNGTFIKVRPLYILADTQSYSYESLDGPFPHNISIAMYVSHFLGDRRYGILAAADGIILLQKGYTGVIKYFVPLPTMYFYSKDWQFFSGVANSSSQIYNSSVPQAVSRGPFNSLPPGFYNATFCIFTDNNSVSNSFGVILSYNYDKPLYYIDFQGNVLKNDSWNNVTVAFYLNNSYSNLNFELKSYTWEGGKISVKSLIIRQIENYSGIKLLPVKNNTVPLPTMYFYSKDWQFFSGVLSVPLLTQQKMLPVCVNNLHYS